MAQIITLGRTSRRFTLRGRAETVPTTGQGDFRDVSFDCGFVGDAVNGPPAIRVSVTDYTNPGLTTSVRVEVRPPDGAARQVEGVMVVPDTDPRPPSRRPRRLTNARATAMVAATSTTPAVLANVNTGSGPLAGFDTPAFGDGMGLIDDPGLPGLDRPDPGGAVATAYVVTVPLEEGADPEGRWSVRVHNLSQDSARFLVGVDHPETVQTLETTRVPFSLLNRVFGEAMLLMSPTVRIHGGRAVLRFRDEFKQLSGVDDIDVSVPDALHDIRLDHRALHAGCDDETSLPTMALDLQFEEVGKEIQIGTPLGDIGSHVTNMAMQFGFHFALHEPDSDFFTSALSRNNGRIQRRPVNIWPFLYTAPEITSTLLRAVHYVLTWDTVAEAIEEARWEMQGALGRAFSHHISDYVRDLLVQIVERDHAIHTLTCDDDAVIVQHHALPVGVGPHRPQAGGSGGGPELVVTGQPEQVRLREGEVDHIVFLMMENRSFDHMLGYLALEGKANLNGLTGTESNPAPAGNPPYVTHRLTRTHGIPTPPHDHDHTLEQIANGAMSGFARSSSRRRRWTTRA